MTNLINPEDILATTSETSEVLGHLFWFSIGKQMNKMDDLKQKLIDSGVGEAWLPNPIRAVDAFRKATTEIQTRKPTADPKIYKNVLIREVFSNKDMIQRNIVVETVNQNDRTLGYDTKTGVIRLDKKNSSLFFEASDPGVVELCEEAEKKFYLYRDHYSSQHIRVMVTKILNSLAPTPMREQGVIYFVPISMKQRLTDLVTLIRTLENSDAFMVPVIDTNDNRYMVEKKLADHLDSLLEQCRNTAGLRKDQVKMLVNNTNRAIKDFKKYKELIDSEKDFFQKRIIHLLSEVMKLIQE